MKKPLVFSLVREQSVFMTAIMGFMTFLGVVALGIAIAIGTGVARWNHQWDAHATIQVSDTTKNTNVKKILAENKDKIESQREITTEEMTNLMQPWISGGRDVVRKYLPIMYEVKFKSNNDMNTVADSIAKHARFITHRDALRPSVSAGWKMILILGLVLGLVITAIGLCVSFIARNTAVLHRRELEILNQVGASDSFVARQMQIVVTKICIVACGFGFLAAVPVLCAIIAIAGSARVGLMAMLALGGSAWGILLMVPALIVMFAIIITRRTTLKILSRS